MQPNQWKPNYNDEITPFLNKTSTHVYSHQESDQTHFCWKTLSVNFATTLDHLAQQAQPVKNQK